ncbi:hypothetical protein HanIR_Chr13g0622091 [Helianthus annuus]|nr:hypothetical protein HanIR_Chr13g0622091 [Helianthus annuus]
MPSHYFFLTSVKTVTGSPCPSLSCCLTLVKTVTGSPFSGDSYKRPTHTPRFPSFRRQPPAKHPPPPLRLWWRRVMPVVEFSGRPLIPLVVGQRRNTLVGGGWSVVVAGNDGAKGVGDLMARGERLWVICNPISGDMF